MITCPSCDDIEMNENLHMAYCPSCGYAEER